MSVTVTRQAFLAAEWRDAVATNPAVQAVHPLAVSTVEESLLLSTADAQAESERRLAFRAVRRMRFELLVPMTDETDQIDLGDVIELQSDRYGMSVVGSDAGALLRVLEIAPNAKEQTILITAWGLGTTANLVTSTGDYLVTSAGEYLVTG